MKNLNLTKKHLQHKTYEVEKQNKVPTENANKPFFKTTQNTRTLKKSNKKTNLNEKEIIPVFFAADVNYLPYLSVTLHSLKANANKRFFYKIYVLHTGVEECEQNRFLHFNDDGFYLEFINVAQKLEKIKKDLQLRDYYTGATYYRIFIASMFPEYDKAIYLDCDTVILGDISKFYNVALNNCILGAVPDKVVNSNIVFKKYSREVLGIDAQKYFNAGVLLINLKKFRTENFYEKFCSLLAEYKFTVAQDQDYLNVICKNKVKYLPYSWNTMPVGGKNKNLPYIVHYNLTLKPWHYADIPYAEQFWNYAKSSDYYDYIQNAFKTHTLSDKKKDEETEKKLIELARFEIDREDNFIKTRKKLTEKQNAEHLESLFTGNEFLNSKAEKFFNKNGDGILSV